MSEGSGLHGLLLEAGEEMWSDDYLRQITWKEVNAYRAGNKLEHMFLTIFKENYHLLADNYNDLIPRKLYSVSFA